MIETHTGFDTRIDIEGCQHVQVCRLISSNSRYYGGLALLIRKTLQNGIKILKNSSSELQWVKLLKDYFSLDKNILHVFHTSHPVHFKVNLILTV